MRVVKIGDLTLSRSKHPVIEQTYTADLCTEGRFRTLDVADLRVLAAAAYALATEIERDTN